MLRLERRVTAPSLERKAREAAFGRAPPQPAPKAPLSPGIPAGALFKGRWGPTRIRFPGTRRVPDPAALLPHAGSADFPSEFLTRQSQFEREASLQLATPDPPSMPQPLRLALALATCSLPLQAQGLVKDINAGGSGSSWPSNLVRLQNQVLFSARDGLHGQELWITDGTGLGTQLLKDLHPGAADSNPANFQEFAGRVFFTAETAAGREPWVSDGTPQGTYQLADLNPGPASSSFHSPSFENSPGAVVYRSEAYFNASTGGGTKLFRTDGTSAGTTQVYADSSPYAFAKAVHTRGDHLYLEASEPAVGLELFRFQGDPSSLELVVDANPGPGHGIQSQTSYLNLADTILFGASDGQGGARLWRTDGTPAGSAMVVDGAGSPVSFLPRDFIEFQGKGIYYDFDPVILPTGGTRIMSTDGTAANTFPLAIGGLDFTPNLIPAKDALLFLVNQPGSQLYMSDGTQAGTENLSFPHPVDFTIGLGAILAKAGSGRRILFAASDAAHGSELWTSDGTVAGTGLFADLDPGTTGSGPWGFTRLGNRILFSAARSDVGRELFSVDLTALGGFVSEPFDAPCPTNELNLRTSDDPISGASFDLELSSNLPFAVGAIAVDVQLDYQPVFGPCAGLLAGITALFPIAADASGTARVPAFGVPSLVGLPFYLHAFLVSSPQVAFSNGLEVLIGT